jgi:flagellar FliL protein
MDDELDPLKGPAAPARETLNSWLVVTAALTPLAALVGAFVGWYLVGTAQRSSRPAASAPVVAEPAYPPGALVVELAPVITNLANPPETRVRLQGAIVLDAGDGQKPDLVAAQIAEDILGYLRTASLASLHGPSGLRHLRDDLGERARTRSNGKVRELVIRTLVVQ